MKTVYLSAPDGWRTLAVGEVVAQGDMLLKGGSTWFPVDTLRNEIPSQDIIGVIVKGGTYPVVRRVTNASAPKIAL